MGRGGRRRAPHSSRFHKARLREEREALRDTQRGLPPASDVKVIKADGSVEVQAARAVKRAYDRG